MPTYEYKCQECKEIFSILVSFGEINKTSTPKCKRCGSKNVKRVYSSVTVITSKKS